MPFRTSILVLAVAAADCSGERPVPAAEAEASSRAGASRPGPAGRRLADAARCEALKLRYEQARVGSDRCERDDECTLELRGRFYTGLDGCFRLSRRSFDGAPADRIAEEWLEAGCASSFDLCPEVRSTAACRAGVCRERPPSPIGEDWSRVDVYERATLFLPPDFVEVPYKSMCGTGPDVRAFQGPGLEVRVEYGQDLSYSDLLEKPDPEPLPRRVTARSKKTIGAYGATLVDVLTPDINSTAKAPDGSWPRWIPVRALLVLDVGAPPLPSLRSGSGPVGLSIVIQGDRARHEVASRIFETLSFW
jgi:hypothetical protein